MKSKPRIILNQKDIMLILGCSKITAHRKLKKIRQHFNKGTFDAVSIQEFCEFLGFRENAVKELLSN